MNYINKLFIDKELNEKRNILNNESLKKNNITAEDIENIIKDVLNPESDLDKLKYNSSFYRDLEIFETFDASHNINQTIFYEIDKTFTLGGKNMLKNIIKNPIDNIDILNNRKNVINSITKEISINNTYEELIKSFKILKDKESSIYWFLNSNNNEGENLESIKQMLYFPRIFYFLNNFGIGLSIKNLYRIFLSPVIGILSPISYFIIPYCVLRFKFKLNISFTKYIKEITKTLFLMYKVTNTKFLSLNNLWIGISILIYFQNIISSIDISKLYIQLSKLIINKINDLAEYTQNAKFICNFIYKENYIKHFFNYNNNSFNSQYIDTELFLNNIKKYKWELFRNFGDKLSIYKNLDLNFLKILLQETYCCDVIFNLYLLKQDYKLNSITYINNNSIKPIIFLKDLYHPLNKTKSIKNSAFIDNDKNMIITGPNAAGKSTFIKSIAINTLLAQTICLCYADRMDLTPFSYIASQINTYDINGQKSLFQAEMYNIKNILDNIHNNAVNQKKSIIFLDELFNSTNIIEGISASFSICKMLTKIPTNITIFATHFLYLCKLSKTKKFINYKFEAILDNKNSNIFFPYKIKKGISTQYIALEILKINNFDKNIIEEAINIKNKILKQSKNKKKMCLKNHK